MRVIDSASFTGYHILTEGIIVRSLARCLCCWAPDLLLFRAKNDYGVSHSLARCR
jgi:hypothetical protein